MSSPDTPGLDRARQLVAAVVVDRVADAGPDEDLRDYGLDSVRVMDLIDRITDDGGEIGYEDLVGRPTLSIIASALDGAAAGTEGNR